MDNLEDDLRDLYGDSDLYDEEYDRSSHGTLSSDTDDSSEEDGHRPRRRQSSDSDASLLLSDETAAEDFSIPSTPPEARDDRWEVMMDQAEDRHVAQVRANRRARFDNAVAGAGAGQGDRRDMGNVVRRAGPGPQGLARRRSVVDLTADSSDEDDIVFVDGPPSLGPARPPAAGPRQPGDFAATLQALDRTLEARRQQQDELFRQEAEHRRELLSPPPVPDHNGGQIRLGGAVLQRGNRQIRYPRPPAVPRGRNHMGFEAMDIIERARFGDMGDDEEDGNGAGAVRAGFFGRIGDAFGLRRNYLNGGVEIARADRGQPYLDINGFGQGIYERFLGPGGLLMGVNRDAGAVAGAGAGGQRNGELNVQQTIALIPKFDYHKPMKGFTDNFDLDSQRPIEIDESGKPIKRKKKAALLCGSCNSRLLLSSSYKNEDDRLWTLRCGHLIDQKCLKRLSTPQTKPEEDRAQPPVTLLQLLDAQEDLGPPAKRSTKRRKTNKAPTIVRFEDQPKEYRWKCPVTECRREHVSVLYPGEEQWKQRPGKGAIQTYM